MWRRLANWARRLREGADAAIDCKRLLDQLVRFRYEVALANSPRYEDPKRLLASRLKVFSQGYEDGMIAEVYRRIETTTRRFIEFGIEDGLECNSTLLLLQGWSGAWIEASAERAARARGLFESYPVEIVAERVTAENADELIGRLAGDDELDLLSIDIDSNDYWVWKAITSVEPRLVVVEYNATFPPEIRKTVAYDPSLVWDGSNYLGASLGALEVLGREKGYSLVGCSPTGVNAFFVREDLVDDQFCSPFTAVNHYEPPRYGLAGPAGHPPGMGPWVDV